MPSTPAASANDSIQFNRYGALCAEVYVLDKPPGALFDIGYYTRQLKALDGPVLEAGCGSGRLLAPMLEAGLDYHGFDRSPDMLAECRKACDARGLNADLRQMTFEDFAYDEPFAAIVSPVGTFTLIGDYDAALAVLRRFHAHLRPGGRLFVDLMPLGYLSARHNGVRAWTNPVGDLLRVETQAVQTDFAAQRRISHLRYERWRGGRLIDTELDVMATRSWGVREFELTLKEAGFTAVTVCGDYRPGAPPASTNGYWCFEARKT